MENNYKRILNKHGFFFKKAYGQNFLSDESLLDEIVEKSGVCSGDTVLEIGLGAGALTKSLAKKAGRVIGYEIDVKLKPVLNDVLAECSNVEIVFKDVMKESIKNIDDKCGENFILVANLPYYITTPVIMRFLEESKNVKAMFVMVQQEVAERLASSESTSDYGAITVAINLRGSASILMKVGREKFYPIPNVDSAVIGIVLDRNKSNNLDLENIRKVVRIAFQNRRKTLANNLINALKISRSQVESILENIGVSILSRGEELSSEKYVELTKQLKEYLK